MLKHECAWQKIGQGDSRNQNRERMRCENCVGILPRKIVEGGAKAEGSRAGTIHVA